MRLGRSERARRKLRPFLLVYGTRKMMSALKRSGLSSRK
jgi:hypothetical protein